MKKRIMFTGGNGFIGSCVIHKMAQSGYEIASYDKFLNFIDNDTYYHRSMEIRKKYYTQPSKVYEGDIRDKEALEQAVTDFKPDILVHLAGLPMARPLKKFEDQMIPINMIGTLNTLEVFERSSAEKIIYTSSSMAYGHFKQTPQGENYMLNPENSYGACKAAGEYFVKLSKKNWVIIRPTSVYGFTDCANRVSQLLIDAAWKNKPAWVVKGEILDFSYIEDVAEGFILAIEKPEANHETFNISYGEGRAATEYAEIVKSYFPKFHYEVKEPTTQQVYRGPQDVQKAKKILGFQPKYPIEKGIEKIIDLCKEFKFYDF